MHRDWIQSWRAWTARRSADHDAGVPGGCGGDDSSTKVQTKLFFRRSVRLKAKDSRSHTGATFTWLQWKFVKCGRSTDSGPPSFLSQLAARPGVRDLDWRADPLVRGQSLPATGPRRPFTGRKESRPGGRLRTRGPPYQTNRCPGTSRERRCPFSRCTLDTTQGDPGHRRSRSSRCPKTSRRRNQSRKEQR